MRLLALRTMYLSGALLLGALALALSSCGATSSGAARATSAPTGTLAATVTVTTAPQAKVGPSPTPLTIVKRDNFTCPATADGSDKAIADALLLLRVAYPSSWNETHCTRTQLSDGSVTLWIGNYVHIDAVPDTTTTVQQYVTAHETSYEKVTLQAISVRQATEAFSLDDQLDQSAPSPAAFHFSQVHAILRGSQYLYLLTTSLDVEYQDTSADTVPPGSVVNYIADWSVS